MLKIPYGRADFEPMMREKCYYVDRTPFLEQLEIYAPVYTMFLRPRRFGKSLWISILEHYYDVNKAADFQLLFGHLHVGQHPTPLANQYRILRFDFSGIETNDVRNVHDAFLLKVKDGFQRFMKKYAENFTAAQQEVVLNQTMASSVAVNFFGYCEPALVQRPIYILIDEYDQFTNELLSFHFADFKDIVSKNGYVRKFYEVLKEAAMRAYVARIFMTGVAPVTVDSMTSGFNIVTDISLRPRFHNMMGFTEPEVTDLLRQIQIEEPQRSIILEDLRQWYDGYRFNMDAPHHLYNPEMVLYFADYYQSEGKYPVEMLTPNQASYYKKIANIFRIGNQEGLALTQLNQFLESGEIKSYLTKKFNIELGFGITEIWSMLFYMGMTTIKAVLGNYYTFQLPNYVIKSLYYDYFMALQLGMSYGNLRHEISESIYQLVMHGDIQPFTKYVSQVLAKEHSNRDNYGYNEKHLKTLVIGMLFPYESYLIRSEMEINRRYVDIFLERIPQVDIKHEILLELKYIKKENANKWVDKDGKLVDPPAPPTPAKKVAKSKKPKTPAPAPPVVAAPVPVKPLLDDVMEKGYQQLCEYMALPRFQRPNLLGFCLVFVGVECAKILPYQGIADFGFRNVDFGMV
jgi:Predicted AAA-ATPase/PD-(D/E)XK nuclease superfamily